MDKKTNKPHDVNLRISRLKPEVFAQLKKEADDMGVSVTVYIAILLTKHVRGS